MSTAYEDTIYISGISPCEQNIGSAAGAAEVSAPPSGPRLKFDAAAPLLSSAGLPRRLSPHPSGAERQRVTGQKQFKRYLETIHLYLSIIYIQVSGHEKKKDHNKLTHPKLTLAVSCSLARQATRCLEWRSCPHFSG